MVNGEPETALVGCTGAYPSTVALLLATVLALISPTSASATTPTASLESVLNQASSLAPLETVIVASNGQVVAEHGYRGHTTTAPTNIKSASKLVISALVGIAIDKGVLEGTDQPVALLLAQDLPAKPDPRLQQLTIGHLLSMQAGLGSTSGPGYGAWVGSRNWVQAALARPFEDEPGRPDDLLHRLHPPALGDPDTTERTFDAATRPRLAGATRRLPDRRLDAGSAGHLHGGNEMAMSPRSLAFGELYRTGGVTPAGERLISREWIDTSWQLRTRSPWTGDGHGYAWFLTRIAGEDVRYGWGYGGQMLYLVPRLGLTVVMTSNESASSAQSGHRNDLHRLLGRIIVAAIQADHALGTASANRVSKNAWTSAHERRSASSW
ncbi:TPA: serine hydrolase [Pseudomonas aeruginosa]|uniref:serine hydrolase domain-containing protein n=1 Tax=Pseudomonas putida TaxID=303 RepID=UPI0012FDA3F9|nr:serine hydrolase [Pseudomonas putida]MBF8160897.1 serine hydrolase [Pseudomonas mendocina]HCF5435926.1 serine hydrolase [Pseudomonas aeruginosa]